MLWIQRQAVTFSCITVLICCGTTAELVYKLVGDELNIGCSVDRSTVFQWERNGESVKDSVTLKTSSTSKNGRTSGSLTKNGTLTVEDSGVYKCIANANSEPPVKLEVILEYDVVVFSIVGENKTVTPDLPLVELQCVVENATLEYKPITWRRNMKNIVNDTSEALKYTITQNSPDTILQIGKPGISDAGLYTCVVEFTNINMSFNHSLSVRVAPSIELPKPPRSKVEGDDAIIQCKVRGYPVPEVVWYRKLEEGNGEMVKIELGQKLNATLSGENATLEIKDLKITEDRGEYMCVATNNLGSANATTFLKVKDKLAAVWPFLGICAEVIILCAVIFIFEKRRNKRMEEEAEVDAVKQELMSNANGNTEDAEVRQRQPAAKS